MNNVMNPMALLAANGMSFADRSKEALTMVIMGMVMVFLVLAIIMLVLLIMERVFAGKTAKPETPKAAPAPRAEIPVAPAVTSTEDEGAVVAAITAAISAMLAEENGGTYQGGFRVVSFKRSSRGTPWNSLK